MDIGKEKEKQLWRFHNTNRCSRDYGTGDDVTVVSYGSTFNLCEQAADILADMNISCELIDVQTLLPFDINML